MVGQSGTNTGDNAGLENIVEDTTPQLGGQLDINGQAIGDGTLELTNVSTSDGTGDDWSGSNNRVNQIFNFVDEAKGNKTPFLVAIGEYDQALTKEVMGLVLLKIDSSLPWETMIG